MKKSTIFIALLIFISLAIFTSVSFAEDEDRSYSIPFANIHLYIQEDGSLHVVETISYLFDGTYNGVTRDIPFKSHENIRNLKVTTEGAYSEFTSYDEDGEKHIKVYLYSNSEKTKPVSNKRVDVTYEYDFINVLKVYDDGATLHYTLWGEGWDVDLGKLNAYIHLYNNNNATKINTNTNTNTNTNANTNTNTNINTDTDVKYWLNPSDLISSSKWNNNTLEATTNDLFYGQLVELRMIVPKNYFNNPIYALQEEGNGTAAFENLQKDYESGVNFFTYFYGIFALIILILCFVPVLIYLIYGREPKISYQGIYEHEPPTDDSPAMVNALYRGNVGSVNMDAFKATILSLINKKYLAMENFEKSDTNIDNEDPKNPTILFNSEDLSNLSSFELSAFKTLKLFADRNEKLDLEDFKHNMKNETSAKRFRDYYNSWCKEVNVAAGKNIEKFFDSTGSDLAAYFGVGGLILSGIIILLWIFGLFPFSYVGSLAFVIIAAIPLIIASIISLVLPNHILGRWTLEGRENDKKWEKFKKYLTDFSLIKEYPPSSVIVWNQYLVYATALGIAKSVQNSMEKLIPREVLDSSDSYTFYDYGGGYMLFSSFDSGITTASAADSGSSSGSGGSGGFGGGSGGGGGGAF